MRFAILGAGRIGQVHADALTGVPGARLIAMAEPDASAAQAMKDRHGCDIRSIDEIASSDDVDAVLICTPTDTHADLIEQFARAGKAIFCEKPIDLELDRVRDCLQVVEETGAFLMIGFQRRFEPDFNVIQQSIQDGKLGTVEMVQLTSRDPSPPPVSYLHRAGGIFRDMVIHDFDVARWMLGEEPTRVMAAASVLTEPELATVPDHDAASVLMTTDSGKHCQISVIRRVTYGYDQRIEVHGSKGAMTAMNHPEANVIFADERGYTRPPNKHFFITRYIEAYRLEITAFVEAVTQGNPPPVSGEDGLRALVLALAAKRSVDEGRAVHISEILQA